MQNITISDTKSEAHDHSLLLNVELPEPQLLTLRLTPSKRECLSGNILDCCSHGRHFKSFDARLNTWHWQINNMASPLSISGCCLHVTASRFDLHADIWCQLWPGQSGDQHFPTSHRDQSRSHPANRLPQEMCFASGTYRLCTDVSYVFEHTTFSQVKHCGISTT